MTPARKAALQWYHNRGASPMPPPNGRCGISYRMLDAMRKDGQVDWTDQGWALTDKGRRMLHGDAK